MDTDSNRTTPESVDVLITSDLEPVKCSGTYREATGGFVLKFDIGNDGYTVEHCDECTCFACDGMQTYRVELKDAATETTLATPFGDIRFGVATKTHTVEHTADGLRINLVYSLESDGVAADRAVEIIVKFKEKGNESK